MRFHKRNGIAGAEEILDEEFLEFVILLLLYPSSTMFQRAIVPDGCPLPHDKQTSPSRSASPTTSVKKIAVLIGKGRVGVDFVRKIEKALPAPLMMLKFAINSTWVGDMLYCRKILRNPLLDCRRESARQPMVGLVWQARRISKTSQ